MPLTRLKDEYLEQDGVRFLMEVDAYQDLPDDFMMRALATPRDGKASVLGYKIYSRVP